MNPVLLPDLLFATASVVLSASLVPQIAKVYKKKSASQFSWWFLVSTAIGTGMFSVGKFMIKCYIASTVDTTVFLGYVLLNILKYRYRTNP